VCTPQPSVLGMLFGDALGETCGTWSGEQRCDMIHADGRGGVCVCVVRGPRAQRATTWAYAWRELELWSERVVVQRLPRVAERDFIVVLYKIVP
jgi:hypothetical protein